MFNIIREAEDKIARLKKYVPVKVYDSFYDLNKNYKSGIIYAGLDWQSKYFVDQKYKDNILNFNLIDFAKNKYRTYKVAEELGIPTLKTIMICNPKYISWINNKDIEEVFKNDNTIVIKPNDAGTARRIFKTTKNCLEYDCINKMWDEYILCQEYIEGDYQDIRVVIIEPYGIVDSFSRLPANVIDSQRDYQNRIKVEVNGKLLEYVNRYRNYIRKNFSSKFMFYSIDFYKTDKGLVFGEINNNIGIHLVSNFCMEKIKEELDK